MTLFSASGDLWSHRTRFVAAEKDLEIEIIDVDASRLPEDLLDINPYNTLPTLVDRDLVLYDSRVIMEYFDERFPHPPLMPVDPVSRAKTRLALYRIERDWYGTAIDFDHTEPGDDRRRAELRARLRETVLQSAELFKVRRFFLSDEFSLVDATLGPILWRMPYYGVDLTVPQAQPILKYANALFARPSFRASLSAAELEERPLR